MTATEKELYKRIQELEAYMDILNMRIINLEDKQSLQVYGPTKWIEPPWYPSTNPVLKNLT